MAGLLQLWAILTFSHPNEIMYRPWIKNKMTERNVASYPTDHPWMVFMDELIQISFLYRYHYIEMIRIYLIRCFINIDTKGPYRYLQRTWPISHQPYSQLTFSPTIFRRSNQCLRWTGLMGLAWPLVGM